MNRTFRLTRQAEDSLVGIAVWTLQNFGLRQADIYEAEVIARCEAIAKREVTSRSCSALVSGAEGLQFARAGEHFLVFLENNEEVVIVDVLHSRSDLPRHVSALSTLGDVGRKDG